MIEIPRRIATQDELLGLAGRISVLVPKPPLPSQPVAKPLFRSQQEFTSFDHLVAHFAGFLPKYKGVQYDRKLIAESVSRVLSDPKVLSSYAGLNGASNSTLAFRVNHSIVKLIALGILPKTPTKRAPRLRTVDPAELVNSYPLIERVVRYGLPLGFSQFAGYHWQSHLTEDEARNAGLDGLINAIACFDKSRGKSFEKYALGHIAGKIAGAVRKRMRQEKRREAAGLSMPRVEQEKPSGPLVDSSYFIPHVFSMHSRGAIPSRDAVIWLLLHRHGLRGKEVADYFSLHNSRVSQIRRKINDLISKKFRQ